MLKILLTHWLYVMCANKTFIYRKENLNAHNLHTSQSSIFLLFFFNYLKMLKTLLTHWHQNDPEVMADLSTPAFTSLS